jgi:hypothetical protein
MASNPAPDPQATSAALLCRCDALEAHLSAVQSFSRQDQAGIAHTLRTHLKRIALQLGEGVLTIEEAEQRVSSQEAVLSVFEGAVVLQQHAILQLAEAHQVSLQVAIAVAVVRVAVRGTDAARPLVPNAPEAFCLLLEREQARCLALSQDLLEGHGALDELRRAFDALWQAYVALETVIEPPDLSVYLEVQS